MKDKCISRHTHTPVVRQIFLTALLLIIFTAASASAANLEMTGYIDGYRVTMTVIADKLPAVGTNQVFFELKDSSNRDVADIADIGVTYELAGVMPRKNMSLNRIPGGYSGILYVNKAALYDVFFIFERRGEKQRVVRFSFQTKDNVQGVPQYK